MIFLEIQMEYQMNKQIKIIGAGLFGCAIGYELDRLGHNIVILEQDSDIMLHASK